ncbi:MAG: prenyltransferase/squalene oxidase repeat-containing protein [Calditrichaceae bacterium]
MFKILRFGRNLINAVQTPNTRDRNIDLHLDEAYGWLCRAQDATKNGGVSSAFHLYRGWLTSYPETTGYIIETLLDYHHIRQEESIIIRVRKMADWLLEIQFEDGAFPDMSLKKKMVFDTGQIIFGLIKIFEFTKDEKYLDSAVKAADWLLKTQDKDGAWRNGAYNDIPHTYYSRVAWSLLKVHQHASDDKYLRANRINVEWALSNQQDTGWFKNAAFTLKDGVTPFTHTIAYTLRGILESGIYLNKTKYITSVVKAVDALIEKIPDRGFISGIYDKNWNGNPKFSCLTGSAQLAIILFILAKELSDQKYYIKGTEINTYLMSRQNISGNNIYIRGGIAGSYPIWGNYIHFAYPNWAAKFFMDSLLKEKRLSQTGVFAEPAIRQDQNVTGTRE